MPSTALILESVQRVSSGYSSVKMLISPPKQKVVGGVDVDGDMEVDGSDVGSILVDGDVEEDGNKLRREEGIGLGADDGRSVGCREGIGLGAADCDG